MSSSSTVASTVTSTVSSTVTVTASSASTATKSSTGGMLTPQLGNAVQSPQVPGHKHEQRPGTGSLNTKRVTSSLCYYLLNQSRELIVMNDFERSKLMHSESCTEK